MKRNYVSWLALGLFTIWLPVALQAQEYKFVRSIGRPPVVGEPRGLAVDPLGNIYTADRVNGRIVKISADKGRMEEGRMRMETQLFQTAERLERPSAVAVDREGNVLVADEARGTVQRYSTRGVHLKTLGRPEGRPELGHPAGVSVDTEGNVYVSDQANNQVLKFNAEGQLLKSLGKKGSEPGTFLGPRGVTVDSRGNLYVADEFNTRIQKFDPNGNLLALSDPKTLGATMSGGLGPTDVAVDSKGNIWVAAHLALAVYKLDPEFNIRVRLETFGRRDGQLAGPIAVSVDSSDNVYVLDNSRRIQKFSPEGNFTWKFAFPEAKASEFSAPTGVLVDPDGNLYVSDTANFRIQKFDRDGRYLLSFGKFGQGPGEFSGAESMAIDRHGTLYVVDSHNHRVQKFDRSGKFLGQWGSFGSREGEFNRTKVVQVDLARDWAYVNDWHNNRVQKFDLNGNFLASFGNTGRSKTRVLGPSGLAIDKEGNVYVSSWYNNAIQKFDLNGKFLKSLGREGTGDGQFKGPARLALDREGNVVVADWGNSRVQVFDAEGRFITKFGSLGRAEGLFNMPVGVVVDSSGNVFVSDAANSRVQMFSKSSISSSGSMPSSNATGGSPAYGQVAIYDIAPGAAQDFETALLSTQDATRAEPSFINDRMLRNLDPLTLQYATYSKFSSRAGAERILQQRLAKVRSFCRREPEVHLAVLTHAYFAEEITDHPTGMEFGSGITGQIAHLGLFIPFPSYREEYDGVLHRTKAFTRSKKPTGYIGEDILVEADLPPPERQAPYSPRPLEPSKMSINYGEYRTMEDAENSYVSRQESQDPNWDAVTTERVFLSILQVPTRFYIFQVVSNYSRPNVAVGNRTAANIYGK